MSKIRLDATHYIEFIGGSTPTLALVATREGKVHPEFSTNGAPHKKAGLPMGPACLGYFGSILGALKFYANVLTSRARDMSIHDYIPVLVNTYKNFNDVSWLDLAKVEEVEGGGANNGD